MPVIKSNEISDLDKALIESLSGTNLHIQASDGSEFIVFPKKKFDGIVPMAPLGSGMSQPELDKALEAMNSEEGCEMIVHDTGLARDLAFIQRYAPRSKEDFIRGLDESIVDYPNQLQTGAVFSGKSEVELSDFIQRMKKLAKDMNIRIGTNFRSDPAQCAADELNKIRPGIFGAKPTDAMISIDQQNEAGREIQAQIVKGRKNSPRGSLDFDTSKISQVMPYPGDDKND